MRVDFLVIGCGISGLNFALKASRYGSVILLTKDNLEESTPHAGDDPVAVFGKDDSTILHIHDTLKAGDGISNKYISSILAKEAPRRVLELQKLGIRFDTDKNGFHLSRKPVHSRARIVHISDTTGSKIQKALIDRIRETESIQVLEHGLAFQLIAKKNRCIGCKILNTEKNEVNSIFAKKIVLATGGIGKLFSRTTNSEHATGDGIAMAFRIGAQLEDMEFIQFHPTLLNDSSPPLLIPETLRGEGGIMRNRHQQDYMKKYSSDSDLAPSGIVSRSSFIEMKKTHSKNVFLDITHLDSSYLKKRFPSLYKACLKHKIDMTAQPLPVCPAAHFLCGGIKTDEFGRTNIRNLYAIGECACTQLHGADKLASNSITEELVFSARLLEKIKWQVRRERIIKIKTKPVIFSEKKNKTEKLKRVLQDTMQKQVGIIRSKKSLKTAEEKIDKIRKKFNLIKNDGINKDIIELDNMLLLAKIIITAAWRRKESRGTHFFEDYGERYDNIWRKHLTIDKRYNSLEEFLQ